MCFGSLQILEEQKQVDWAVCVGSLPLLEEQKQVG